MLIIFIVVNEGLGNYTYYLKILSFSFKYFKKSFNKFQLDDNSASDAEIEERNSYVTFKKYI